jgi:hypothetical protein
MNSSCSMRHAIAAEGKKSHLFPSANTEAPS